MLAARKEWVLDPYPAQDPHWVIRLVQFGETLGEKCNTLLEGNEGEQQRTYIGFGEGWILSPQTFFSQVDSLPAVDHHPNVDHNPAENHDPTSHQSPSFTPDPLTHLRAFREANFPGSDFESGIIGYLDYEWGLYWQKPQASFAQPSYFFRLCPVNLVLLPLTQKVILEVFSENEQTLTDTFDHWGKELDSFLRKDNSSVTRSPSPHDSPTLASSFSNWQSNMSREDFLSRVEEIKEFIRAGDIFQAVLSQRFTIYQRLSPWPVYQKLRLLNPSPWLFCVLGEKETLVGSSPELLISSLESRIQTRPIAGTRPRGKTFEEDQNLENELRQDSKEMAEHAMLVDLGRNDLGRVAAYGSVKVSEYASIQRFSHVMHLVSTVEGKLHPSYDSLDALRAVFPAGTLSGAPKVRAMEILQASEPTPRGAYGGALGIYRWNGDLDFCITIRTLSLEKEKVHIQAGAGIVYDSIPVREYEETLHKARVLFKVIENLVE